MTRSLHGQYLAGEHDAVWYRLYQLGSRVREDKYREDAEAVAREAMGRAAANVHTIIDRLQTRGYRFGDPHDSDGATVPHSPPDDQTRAFATWLDQRFGPLPLTVRAWIDIVGDVCLLGSHPDWPADVIADPLVIEFEYKSWAAAKDRNFGPSHHENEFDAWRSTLAEVGPAGAGPFSLAVAPDALHKANISGGAPYGVVLPDAGADATFLYEDGVSLPFIEYLRISFESGGFPGLTRRGPRWLAERCRHDLAAELLPL